MLNKNIYVAGSVLSISLPIMLFISVMRLKARQTHPHTYTSTHLSLSPPPPSLTCPSTWCLTFSHIPHLPSPRTFPSYKFYIRDLKFLIFDRPLTSSFLIPSLPYHLPHFLTPILPSSYLLETYKTLIPFYFHSFALPGLPFLPC